MKECRTCGRRFGSMQLFDAHLGSDAELQRGINARLRGEPSQAGHRDPKGGTLTDGVWRLPPPSWSTTTPAGGLLTGLPREREA